MLQRLYEAVEAEQMRAAGRARDAIAKLDHRNGAAAPYQWHVVRAAVLHDAGEHDAAEREEAWLAVHAGRAWSDALGGQAFQAMNVIDLHAARQRRSDIAGTGSAYLRRSLSLVPPVSNE